MAETTDISWCDSTFNPWIGCTKVSPACDHCYAERDMAIRRKRVEWGAGKPRSRTSADNWKRPRWWNDEPFVQCASCGRRGEQRQFFFAAELAENLVHELQLEHVEVPGAALCTSCEGGEFTAARRRVFCASLADIFDNEVDPSWRAELFALIAATPNLDWLLLTKRIGNAARLIDEALAHPAYGVRVFGRHPALNWPWPNVWLGSTVVNQEEAERDIPKLIATPARVRFLSIEPMLGPVDVAVTPPGRPFTREVRVDWVIAGGESGPGARPAHPDWIRSLRDQCAAAGVAFHFKQWGEWYPGDVDDDGERLVAALDCEHNPRAWEIEGRWKFDASIGVGMFRVGKEKAGRLLDGRTHDGFPQVAS